MKKILFIALLSFSNFALAADVVAPANYNLNFDKKISYERSGIKFERTLEKRELQDLFKKSEQLKLVKELIEKGLREAGKDAQKAQIEIVSLAYENGSDGPKGFEHGKILSLSVRITQFDSAEKNLSLNLSTFPDGVLRLNTSMDGAVNTLCTSGSCAIEPLREGFYKIAAAVQQTIVDQEWKNINDVERRRAENPEAFKDVEKADSTQKQ